MAIPDPDDSTLPTPREVKAVVELLRWVDMPGLDQVTLTEPDVDEIVRALEDSSG